MNVKKALAIMVATPVILIASSSGVASADPDRLPSKPPVTFHCHFNPGLAFLPLFYCHRAAH